MARRLPSAPPLLPGFSHVRVLGMGGFADVFLYEQNLPRRQVAVKVLLSEVVDDTARRMFQAEANLMAQLSAHPSVLTVFGAGVAADGRPWLAMELCSSALGERYRRDVIAVSEVLRIAVQVGGALETAHRAGVLHRDLKPANILSTAYGHPVLSDFGIAATLGPGDSAELVGMSVPWSAPEVLSGETAGTVASEVWAFAATAYTLLAGRPPFADEDENIPSALARRIGRERLRPTGRDDVPESLEQVLAHGLSADPAARPQTMGDLVGMFAAVEAELGFAPTPIESAIADWAIPSLSRQEDRTVLTAPQDERRVRRRRGSSSREPSSVHGRRRPRARAERSFVHTLWFRVGSAIVVAGLVGFGIVGVSALVASPTAIPTVTGIRASVLAASVTFTWADPGLSSGDSYEVTVTGARSSVQSRQEFTVSATAGERVCLTVSVTRDGRSGSQSAEKCVSVSS